MIDTNKLSWAIYEELKAKGAGIGNASVPIIESVIDKHVAAEQVVKTELLPHTDSNVEWDDDNLINNDGKK